MKTTRVFIVSGKKPAISKAHNDFFSAFDLGVSGAYRALDECVTMTISEDVTQEQLEQHPAALKSAYEAQGCIHVSVVEVPR